MIMSRFGKSQNRYRRNVCKPLLNYNIDTGSPNVKTKALNAGLAPPSEIRERLAMRAMTGAASRTLVTPIKPPRPRPRRGESETRQPPQSSPLLADPDNVSISISHPKTELKCNTHSISKVCS
jgi:hypothetical protein